MTVQTVYTNNIAVALPGLVAYDFGQADIVDFRVTETNGIPFGRAVVRATDDQSIELGNGTSVIGIVARGTTSRQAVDNNEAEWGDDTSAPVVRQGYIWVTNVGTAVTEGATAAFDADGQLDASGTATPNITIETDAAQNALCRLRVSL